MDYIYVNWRWLKSAQCLNASPFFRITDKSRYYLTVWLFLLWLYLAICQVSLTWCDKKQLISNQDSIERNCSSWDFQIHTWKFVYCFRKCLTYTRALKFVMYFQNVVFIRRVRKIKKRTFNFVMSVYLSFRSSAWNMDEFSWNFKIEYF
jgi:hypothetical protein